MTMDPAAEPDRPTKPPPFFRAPMIVVATAGLLLVLHAAFSLSPVAVQNTIDSSFALIPERFWAPAGSPAVYPDAASGLLTLLSAGLLHLDWFHVIVNALMLLAFGTPVARALGPGPVAAGMWMLLFVVSVLGGSALYLVLTDANGPPMIGASGGVSGFAAAAFLLDGEGRKQALWSRPFVGMTVAFALANLLLAATGPFLVGAFLAWEAHAGGYVAGALLMALLPVRGYGWTRS